MSVANAKQMDARGAIAAALALFDQFYEGQRVENVLLEELDYDESEEAWRVTIGFDIGRNEIRQPNQNALALFAEQKITPVREARRFVIFDATGGLDRMEDV